jgi:hypothetical protein
MFHSQYIDRQAARGDALVAVEAGVGRSSGINHGDIGFELDKPIIPGLNCRVNNTRVKFEPWCFYDWHIGTARASLSCSTLVASRNSISKSTNQITVIEKATACRMPTSAVARRV